MRSNLKNIKKDDVDTYSCVEIGKFRYDYRVQLKDGKEIKIKRKLGLLFDLGHEWNHRED